MLIYKYILDINIIKQFGVEKCLGKIEGKIKGAQWDPILICAP